jgi:hypothetical protein
VATLLRGGDYAFTKGSKPDEFDPVIHTEDDNPQKSWDACWQLQVESAAHELPAGKYELYTHPAPQVPMTEAEIRKACIGWFDTDGATIHSRRTSTNITDGVIGFARAVEAHHGVKP